jgi:hypothetical protein
MGKFQNCNQRGKAAIGGQNIDDGIILPMLKQQQVA